MTSSPASLEQLGIVPGTPAESVQAAVKMVHEFRLKEANG